MRKIAVFFMFFAILAGIAFVIINSNQNNTVVFHREEYSIFDDYAKVSFKFPVASDFEVFNNKNFYTLDNREKPYNKQFGRFYDLIFAEVSGEELMDYIIGTDKNKNSYIISDYQDTAKYCVKINSHRNNENINFRTEKMMNFIYFHLNKAYRFTPVFKTKPFSFSQSEESSYCIPDENSMTILLKGSNDKTTDTYILDRQDYYAVMNALEKADKEIVDDKYTYNLVIMDSKRFVKVNVNVGKDGKIYIKEQQIANCHL
jgi:hypothetical protein